MGHGSSGTKPRGFPVQSSAAALQRALAELAIANDALADAHAERVRRQSFLDRFSRRSRSASCPVTLMARASEQPSCAKECRDRSGTPEPDAGADLSVISVPEAGSSLDYPPRSVYAATEHLLWG
jgi:hypothetical protein